MGVDRSNQYLSFGEGTVLKHRPVPSRGKKKEQEKEEGGQYLVAQQTKKTGPNSSAPCLGVVPR